MKAFEYLELLEAVQRVKTHEGKDIKIDGELLVSPNVVDPRHRGYGTAGMRFTTAKEDAVGRWDNLGGKSVSHLILTVSPQGKAVITHFAPTSYASVSHFMIDEPTPAILENFLLDWAADAKVNFEEKYNIQPVLWMEKAPIAYNEVVETLAVDLVRQQAGVVFKTFPTPLFDDDGAVIGASFYIPGRPEANTGVVHDLSVMFVWKDYQLLILRRQFSRHVSRDPAIGYFLHNFDAIVYGHFMEAAQGVIVGQSLLTGVRQQRHLKKTENMTWAAYHDGKEHDLDVTTHPYWMMMRDHSAVGVAERAASMETEQVNRDEQTVTDLLDIIVDLAKKKGFRVNYDITEI